MSLLVAARLARREVRRRPVRTLLVVALVAVPVAAGMLAAIAYRADHAEHPFRVGNATFAVHVSALAPGLEPGDVVQADGAAESGWDAQLPFRREGGGRVQASVTTVDWASSLLRSAVRFESGGAPQGASEVFLGRDLAAHLGVTTGDVVRFEVPAVELTVAGVGAIDGRDADVMWWPGLDVSLVERSGLTASVYSAARIEVDEGGWRSMWTESGAPPRPADPQELLLGWLGLVLVLGVTGIVVAAAFAVTGRRQLVTIGLLSANGARAATLRALLALQGAVTGLIGGLLGVGAGYGVAVIIRRHLRAAPWEAFRVGDAAVLLLTAVGVAAGASLLPVRALATAPVLDSLAGRAPVPQAKASSVVKGVGVFAVGLAVIYVVLNNSWSRGQGGTERTLLVMASALAMLAGICMVAPAAIAATAAAGSLLPGTARMALRGLGRHRTRSAALLAAVTVVVAAGVVAGVATEDAFADDWAPVARPQRQVVLFSAYDTVAVTQDGYTYETAGQPVDLPAEVRRDVDATLRPAEWVEVTMGDFGIVATDEVLDALAFTADQRAELAQRFAATPEVWVERNHDGGNVMDNPALPMAQITLLSPASLEEPGRVRAKGALAVYLHPLTAEEVAELTAAAGWWGSSWVGDAGAAIQLDIESPDGGRHISGGTVRWLVINGVLLLVSLVLVIGLALWAAEGRTERDQLIAAGAGPRRLAALDAVRAGVLSALGVAAGVALGWLVVRVVGHAVRDVVRFPTVVVVGLAGIPLLLTAAVWIGGWLVGAQRVAVRTAGADFD